MLQKFKTTTIPLSKIQAPNYRQSRKNIAAQRKAMQAIRRGGQQRPLIIAPDGRLLSDTASYLALKALDYDVVKVFTLMIPSPAAVHAIGRLLDRCEAIRREAAAFNAALGSLDSMLEIGAQDVALELLPVVIADTGEVSIRLQPALVSDDGVHAPLDI
jgi:hypothetical protein